MNTTKASIDIDNKLKIRLKKLELNDGDVVIAKINSVDMPTRVIKALFKYFNDRNTQLIVIDPKYCDLKTLSEHEMKCLGWIRDPNYKNKYKKG